MALTGFYFQGVCYLTQAEAVNAFSSLSPILDGHFLTTVNAVASGVNGVSISTKTMDLSISANVFLPHSAILPFRVCDPAFSVSPVIDAASILQVFGWGFGAVVLFFCFGYWISVALQAIKKT